MTETMLDVDVLPNDDGVLPTSFVIREEIDFSKPTKAHIALGAFFLDEEDAIDYNQYGKGDVSVKPLPKFKHVIPAIIKFIGTGAERVVEYDPTLLLIQRPMDSRGEVLFRFGGLVYATLDDAIDGRAIAFHKVLDAILKVSQFFTNQFEHYETALNEHVQTIMSSYGLDELSDFAWSEIIDFGQWTGNPNLTSRSAYCYWASSEVEVFEPLNQLIKDLIKYDTEKGDLRSETTAAPFISVMNQRALELFMALHNKLNQSALNKNAILSFADTVRLIDYEPILEELTLIGEYLRKDITSVKFKVSDSGEVTYSVMGREYGSEFKQF